MELFHPYEGDKPYIFISYAHADSCRVMEVVSDMHSRGYRIWYDEGIEVGSEWPECIASHLEGAHLMVAFISNAYMRSDNCRREMHYAISKRRKIINIFLEDTRMTPGMEMQIGNIFALMKHTMGPEQFYRRLYAAPLLNSEAFTAEPSEAACREEVKTPTPKVPEKPQKPGREGKPKKEKRPRPLWKKLLAWLLALLFAAAVITAALIGHFTGLSQRLIIGINRQHTEPPAGSTQAVFTEAVLEQAAREYCGKAEGNVYVSDLYGLRELYVVGGEYFFTADEAAQAAGAAVGQLRELSDLTYFADLERLALISQELNSLESMPACGVEYLDISGCRVSSLQGIGRLARLRELTAEGCPVRELGDISLCLGLHSLKLRGSSISDFRPLKPLTKLSALTLSHCALDELDTALGLSRLTELGFYHCDLRGRFFKALDSERKIVSLTLDNCELSSTVNLEDFSGLTTLTVISSGADLDWSLLRELPALSRVCCDEAMEPAITRALPGNRVEITVIK